MVKLPDPLDRVIRSAMGNPVVKIVTEKTIGSKVVEHYDTPVLTLKRAYVQNFKYLGTFPPHIRRFVVATIRNDGPYSATDCWGQITVKELGEDPIPLHWADESYEMRRNSMVAISIPPGVERDLDISFSILGSESLQTSTSVKTTGQVSTSYSTTPSRETAVTSYGITLQQPESMKGTFSPELASSDSNKLVRVLEDRPGGQIEPPSKGAWLASHLVIAHPITGSEHYLQPEKPVKRYHGSLEVICGNGKGHIIPIILIVSHDPHMLIFDWRITPI